MVKTSFFAIIIIFCLIFVACDQAKVDGSKTLNTIKTSENGSVENGAKTLANNKASCAKAISIINTCAYENVCDENMMMYLPSEPRDHFNSLSEHNWFSADSFTKYCIDACLSKQAKLDVDAFKFEVCGYADDLSSSLD